MRTDACDHVGEVVWLDSVQDRGQNDRVERGGANPTGVAASKEPVLRSDLERPDLDLGGVVRDFEMAVGEIQRQFRPTRAGVADRTGQVALAGEF